MPATLGPTSIIGYRNVIIVLYCSLEARIELGLSPIMMRMVPHVIVNART